MIILALQWERRTLRFITILFLTVLLLFLLYRVARNGRLTEEEAIILKNESARFAPAYSATASFDLPKGTAVYVVDIHENWAKIAVGGKRGWIPMEALKEP
jgi:membrane protein implicated in regulation of membrane protease activity